MDKRLVESLNGVGALYAADTLLRSVPYKLALWSEGDPSATDASPGKVTSIDGHIDITGIAEAVVLAGPEKLFLQLEDGRRLRVQLTSSAGAIVGRGSFEPG
jgi:hypothetical protein